jgi:hypothetical protein
MNIAVVKNTPNNIFAAFGDDITHYGNQPVVLRNKLYLSNLIDKKNYGDVFITTYLSSEQKSCGSNGSPDIENILLYNLGDYRRINDLISMADKIIIQGIDNLKKKLNLQELIGANGIITFMELLIKIIIKIFYYMNGIILDVLIFV